MEQLFTDTPKSLIALVARSEMSGNCDDTSCPTIFFNPEQPSLLNVPDKLGDNDVAGDWQSAILDEKALPALAGDLTVKKKRDLSADDPC